MAAPRLIRRSTAAAAAALVATVTAQAQVVSTLILRTGDVAPQLGTVPATIDSFVEPPSIASAPIASIFDRSLVPIHVTVAGENITPSNEHVIYLWSPSTGLQRVARGGDVAPFDGGNVRGLFVLESPIATRIGDVMFTAQTDRPGRGMVLWHAGQLIGLAEVGQPVTIECESVSGLPCGPVTGATLQTMATFGDRRGAAAQALQPTFEDGFSVLAAFRGAVQTTGFGTPDALWDRAYYRFLGTTKLTPLRNVANSLLKADGITATTTYFDDFTDVALCLGILGQSYDLFGLATVSNGAPYAVYRFDGNHTLLLRHHAPDLVPRRDFHCDGDYLAFAGGVTGAPLDGNTFTRGAWTLREDGSELTQVYSANSTPAPGIPGAALGVPLGQALYDSGSGPRSVFAANLVGSALAGAASVWRGRSMLEDPILLAHEQQATSYGVPIQAIWGVHVNARGDTAFHVRLADQRQAIFVIDALGRFIPALLAGQPLPGAGGNVIMDSFWTLGVTFGADPVVTGTGDDGIQGAFTVRGELPVVVYTRTAAQPPGTSSGAALLHVKVPLPPLPPLFADGFETPQPE